jgi:CO/xanthine dehydrogenase Mo-binding subunit
VTDTTHRETEAPSARGSILGTRVLRTEDPGFLTRGAVYTADLRDERLAGALHATFVRSPVAHARLAGIDVSAAAAAPGVVAVLTADDLGEVPEQSPAMPVYPAAMAQPLLARDVVRFVGEPVAVVLTDDPLAGEDAAELVVLDLDPLPAVVDPRQAVRQPRLVALRARELGLRLPHAAAEAVELAYATRDRRGAHHGRDAVLAGEAAAQGAASRTDDYREGFLAFQQKRTPRFLGR